MTYLIGNSLKRRVVSLVDNVGNLVFGRRDGNRPDVIKSILLIRLDHLGDVLLTTPAIRSLKKQFPQARVTVLVKEWSFEAIKNNPRIDNIIVFNSFWTIASNEGRRPEGVGGIYRLIRLLRKEHFDVAIDFKGDIRNIAIAYLSGAKRRISYAVRGGGFLLTDIVPYEPDIHEIEKNMKLLVPLGIDSDGVQEMELFFADEDMARVDHILNHKGIDLSRRAIALHYGGASKFKRWDLEKFVALAERIAENNCFNILIFGGPFERPFEREDLQLLERPEKGIFLMPDMTICQMAAAFRKCHLLVCNDSGPMHVGLAVDTPTVAIFGPTYPQRFGPKGLEKNRVVNSRLPCSPCWHPDKPIGCTERICLKSIEVESVLGAITELTSS
jgi:lipopolysaccharide heptosyltransferase II